MRFCFWRIAMFINSTIDFVEKCFLLQICVFSIKPNYLKIRQAAQNVPPDVFLRVKYLPI